jgi:hypothetical protein
MKGRRYGQFNWDKVNCITATNLMVGAMAVSGAVQYTQQRRAANAAEAAANRNADLIRQQNSEEVRRKQLENKQVVAESRARAGASGTLVSSGSTQTYLNEMKSVFNAEVDWLKKSGSMQAYNEVLSGKNTASGLRAGAAAGAFNTAGKIFSAYR